jgi:nucleotide-binding universal stress UspA family protein
MQRFKNVLLVIDEKAESTAALPQAVALCHRNEAQLALVNVVGDQVQELDLSFTSDFLANLELEQLEERRNCLEELAEPIRAEGIRVSTKVLVGTPFLEIIREVLRSRHDLVMMTAEGRGGLKEMLFGTTSLHLMRKCPVPVWVVKQDQPKHYTRILAAVNPASAEDQQNGLDLKIMDLATSLAKLEKSELHIVHTWQFTGESTLRGARSQLPQADVDQFLNSVEQAHRDGLNGLLANYDLNGLNFKIHLLKGGARDLIPELAREYEVDLVVMGTVSRTGVAGFFIGNTAESVLQQVNCSVLTVKPEGFVTPVKLDD